MTNHKHAYKLTLYQQELIETRDMLDQKVEQLTLIHKFNQKAILLNQEQDVIDAALDAAVDIFEVEFACFWYENSSKLQADSINLFGLDLEPEERERFFCELKHGQDQLSKNRRYDAKDANQSFKNKIISTGLLSNSKVVSTKNNFMLFIGNSIENADIYPNLRNDVVGALDLFVAQLAAVLDSISDKQKIHSLYNELSSLLIGSPDSLFELDENGKQINAWGGKSETAKITARLIEDDKDDVINKGIRTAELSDGVTNIQLCDDTCGIPTWIELSITKKKSHDNQKFIVSARDISERKAVEQKLEVLSSAISQSPVSIIITDLTGKIEFVNVAFESISGYLMDEVISTNASFLYERKQEREQIIRAIEEVTLGKSWNGQLVITTKNQQKVWEKVHVSPVHNEHNEVHHCLIIKEDITIQKIQEDEITRQAHFDSLTALPNRLSVLKSLNKLITDISNSGNANISQNIAILFIDLDNFKKVNDGFGHQFGDAVLIESGKRLINCVRDIDSVGRLGGDEFLVSLKGPISISDTKEIAERILQAFRSTFSVNGKRFLITLSIGIAFYPDNGQLAHDLMRNADTAMYHAKNRGRNKFAFYSQEMNQCILREIQLEEMMQDALDNEDIYAVFQPQYCLRENTIIGAEALLRWHDSKLGDIKPCEFIPIAEQNGMIVNIGYFIIEKSIKAAKSWINIKSEFRISINLSPKQFNDEQLVSKITSIARSHNFPLRNIVFEITEGVLLVADENTRQTLKTLRALGIGIAMDDFGTGYSSLSYLRKYDFGILKIDQSFIFDMNKNKADCALVIAIITMAKSLGISVVAEGVETEEQKQLLVDYQCDEGQGFLFSRPLAEKDFSERLVITNSGTSTKPDTSA